MYPIMCYFIAVIYKLLYCPFYTYSLVSVPMYLILNFDVITDDSIYW